MKSQPGDRERRLEPPWMVSWLSALASITGVTISSILEFLGVTPKAIVIGLLSAVVAVSGYQFREHPSITSNSSSAGSAETTTQAANADAPVGGVKTHSPATTSGSTALPPIVVSSAAAGSSLSQATAPAERLCIKSSLVLCTAGDYCDRESMNRIFERQDACRERSANIK